MSKQDTLKAKWAKIPGVVFAAEAARKRNDIELSKLPEGWKTTAQLMEMTGMTRPSLLRRLHKAGARYVTLGNQVAGMLAWDPDDYIQVLETLPEVIEKLPHGWCFTEQACKMIGVRNSRFTKLVQNENIRGKRVIYKGSPKYIWKLTEIKQAIANRMKNGVYGHNAEFITCPHCGKQGGMVEATRCDYIAPILCVHEGKTAPVYSASYNKAHIRMRGDDTVTIECSFCGASWQDIEDMLKDVRSKKQHKNK